MIDQVVGVLRDVAEEIVLPRFRNLAAGEVIEKGPGDLVTVADREAEAALTRRLSELLPGSLVVGEEAVAADPTVLARMHEPGPVWVIDPIDGTANYAAGREPFGLMVALIRGGVPVLGAIYEPVAKTLSVAEAGSGAYIDGERVAFDHTPIGAEQLRGAVMTKYLPQELREQVTARLPLLTEAVPGFRCAAHEYPHLIRSGRHFAMFWRSLPWDHTAGALLIREAGGVVRHFDGSDYDPAQPKLGLLVCRDDAVFELVRSVLLE
ncbi:inositol monophosphatase family protein [Catellatospora sp. KI3]|uniref:inositol monophosphatase family protein n=1 Tax=Catellatospora sp. KI3 TaxID=3041620 RepID=UPI0024827C9A|nr:inositol monophosphatase family protein [Catellatospora sp. KI3]MDI1460056.1 inositol monophosphatase family protein [Catellatospora sp. KI3]